MKDGLLWRMYESADGTTLTLHLIVPGKYCKQIVQELHSGALGGHLGADKTHGKLKECFYWPGYWNNVQPTVTVQLSVQIQADQKLHRKCI